MKKSLISTMQHVFACLAVGGGILFSHPSYAQGQTLKDRLTIGTNAFEWLLTVPNVRLELDLHPGPYNQTSALLGIRYNWNTYHQLPPYYVFNVFSVKGEYRYHFRFKEPEKGQKPKFFSQYRNNPRPWIAYYVGAYGEYSSFSIKFSANGRQGGQGGVGVSAGLELPLYQYKGGAVDLDLGASAGIILASYQLYSLNEAATAYITGGRRFIPLPMLTEIRAVFNWRKYSVKDRYVKSDPQIPVFNNTMADIRTNFENTNKQAFDDAHGSKKEKAAYAKSDSLYRADFTAYVMENDEYLRNYIKDVPVDAKHMKKLEKAITDGTRKVLADFDQYFKDRDAAAAASAKEQEKEAKKAEAEKAKAEKAEKAKEPKETKAKETKADKKEAKAKDNKKKGKEETAE